MTLKQIADTMRVLAAQVEALELEPAANVVGVLYRSQWDADAMAFKSDCGPASLAMMLDWYGVHVAIDVLAEKCLMSPVKAYTNAADLIRVAKVYGLSLSRQQPLALKDLENEIAVGRPCIALIKYSDLGDLRQDKGFTGTHWLVIIGFDSTSIVVHDPDWHGAGGANLRIPREVFAKSWGNTMPNGAPYQALVIWPQ